jgi:hypothetical protein
MIILKRFNEYRSLRSKRTIFRRLKAFFQNFQLNDYFFGETVFLGMFDRLNTNLLTKIEKNINFHFCIDSDKNTW